MPELWTENIRLTKFVESEGRELLPALEENLLGQLTKTAGEAYSGISSWRRWMRPNASPAITLLLLTKVQHVASPSQVKVASASPPDSSHTFSVLSEDAETTSRPSRLTATPETASSGLRGCAVRARWPVPTPSASCHRKRRPQAARPALTATPYTHSAWPARVRSSRPLASSHTFSVLS